MRTQNTAEAVEATVPDKNPRSLTCWRSCLKDVEKHSCQNVNASRERESSTGLCKEEGSHGFLVVRSWVVPKEICTCCANRVNETEIKISAHPPNTIMPLWQDVSTICDAEAKSWSG